MKRKNFVLIVCLLFMGLAAGASLAQAQYVKYDTTYFDICLPEHAKVTTRKELDQGLYENGLIDENGAYTENEDLFESMSDIELLASGISGKTGIKIVVYDVNEQYVTMGRERAKILEAHNRVYAQLEADDPDLTVSDAQIFRTDGANFVYADFHYNGSYERFERNYSFTFPWQGKMKLFQLSVMTSDDYADPESIRVVEECLKTLYIKH